MSLIKNNEKLKDRFYALFLPLIFVFINFILKIRYASYPSLALDEPFSVYYAQFDISTIFSELSLGNNPPLYEIFLHIWISIFGISELSVRFPSLVFSSLTVFFIYQICRKFFTIKAAILAVMLFTLSNYQMYFAHEARVYALFVFLTTVSMYLFLKLISSNYSKIDLVFYITISVLLLYSHFFSLFVLFVQFSGLVFSFKKVDLLRFSKYFGIIFIFYLPYIGVFISRFIDSSTGTWIEAVSNLRPIHTFIATMVNNTHIAYVSILIFMWLLLQKYITQFFSNNLLKMSMILGSIFFLLISLSLRLPLFPSYLFPIENEFFSPWIIVSFLLFYFILFIHFQMNKKQTVQGKIILSWFYLPCVIMFVASFFIPVFIDRYLVFVVPGFFIFLSVSISKFDSKLFSSISFFILLLMFIPFSPLSNNKRDVKTVVRNVKFEQENTNNAVFICPDYFGPAFAYYYNKDYFTDVEGQQPKDHLQNVLRLDNVFLVTSDKEVDSISRRNNFEKIIFVDAAADFSYSHNNIKNYLNKKFHNNSVSFDSTHVPGIFNIYSYTVKE